MTAKENRNQIENLKLSLSVHKMCDLVGRLMIFSEDINFDNIWKAYHEVKWAYKFRK